MLYQLADEKAKRSSQAVDTEPRYMRRLSDKLTVAFYAACEIGNLHAAGHLLAALECEVARSVGLGRDKREDGDDLAAVRARLQIELNKQPDQSRMARDLQNQVTNETSPSDAA